MLQPGNSFLPADPFAIPYETDSKQVTLLQAHTHLYAGYQQVQ